MTDAVFDRACFDAFVEDVGDAMALDVLGVFLVDTARRLDRLASAEFCADRETVSILAHSVKSAAATVGFDHLSALARGLEGDADRLTPADLTARIVELRRAFDAAVARSSSLHEGRLGHAV